MSKKSLVTIVGIACVAVMAVVVVPMAYAGSRSSNGEKKCDMDMKKCDMNMKKCDMDMKGLAKGGALRPEKGCSMHFSMVSQSVDKAIKAIEAGNKEAALAELRKVQKMLVMIEKKMGEPKFANVSCPMMGSPINPDKVTKNLVRDYKGQKIAFCCGGCPGQWDKLTDAEKEAKLAKVKPTQSL